MSVFHYDGFDFHYRSEGDGLPFVFQHGLGGDLEQPFSLYQPPAGISMHVFDCQTHGLTEPCGDPDRISIERFADDLGVFLDHLGIETAIVGGISLGAAISLNFVLRYPQRVLGLVQSRPAWLAEPNHDNAERFRFIAGLLRQYGPEVGKQQFEDSAMYAKIREVSLDTASSLSGQFDAPRAVQRAARLERIPLCQPTASLEDLSRIRVPALVLANRQDPVHPFAYGEATAKHVAGAEFREIAAKSASAEQHQADYQEHITRFLQTHFLR